MVNSIKKCIEKDIKILWDDVCTISVLAPNMNKITGRCEYTEKVIYKDILCNLINKKVSNLNDKSPTDAKVTAVILVSKDIDVPIGSKISVVKNGEKTEYAYSGFMKTFNSHKEVPVALFYCWA